MDSNGLFATRIGIDTHNEPLVYMRRDCPICRSEGFRARTRLQIVSPTGKKLIASLNVVDESVLAYGHIGFSRIAWQALALREGDVVTTGHVPVIDSISALRKKIYGHTLSALEYGNIIRDIVAGHYADIEIASFLVACAGDRLSVEEITSLTRAMVECGDQLQWPQSSKVFDKHCIGGIPGNRTTPIVIAICSAAGLLVPKTSSRAITSPAGTADTMEVLTEVDLTLEQMKHTVNKHLACLAWGGAMRLSPADDILIGIEKALDIDSEGQLVASVLSKKIAAGSTHVLIDIPVGKTAKVRNMKQAHDLESLFATVSAALGLVVRSIITDGNQPVGSGIGPVQEAKDIVSVLQGAADAPKDLEHRALHLASKLIAMSKRDANPHISDHELDEQSLKLASTILHNGEAWEKFQHICEAQGGMKSIPDAKLSAALKAPYSGQVMEIDNRRLARLAKLAGAPHTATAGLRCHVRLGSRVNKDMTMFTVYADSQGELSYALDYYHQNKDLITLEAKS